MHGFCRLWEGVFLRCLGFVWVRGLLFGLGHRLGSIWASKGVQWTWFGLLWLSLGVQRRLQSHFLASLWPSEGGFSIAGRVRVEPSTQDPGHWVLNSRSRVMNSESWDHGWEGRGFWVVGWWVVGWLVLGPLDARP